MATPIMIKYVKQVYFFDLIFLGGGWSFFWVSMTLITTTQAPFAANSWFSISEKDSVGSSQKFCMKKDMFHCYVPNCQKMGNASDSSMIILRSKEGKPQREVLYGLRQPFNVGFVCGRSFYDAEATFKFDRNVGSNNIDTASGLFFEFPV